MISIKPIIICGALLLPQQNYTKNWDGSDLPGHSFAKFDHFSGKQTFTIKLDQQGDFVFKYKANVDKGSLQLEVKSPRNTVFNKELKGEASGEIKVPNPKAEKFKFILKGKDASGNYDITYGANATP